MSFKQYQKLYISPSDMEDPKDLARVINSLQQNVQDAVNPMAIKVQNDSTLLTNISLKVANNPTTINHTLGRVLLGYNVMLKGNAVVWDSQDSNKSPQLTLLLNTSADVTISLLVY